MTLHPQNFRAPLQFQDEENGIIDKYATVINRKSLGYGLTIFVQGTLQGHTREAVAEFDNIMQHTQEIMECHRVTDIADYLLKVAVRDHEHLDEYLMNNLLPLPSVERITPNTGWHIERTAVRYTTADNWYGESYFGGEVLLAPFDIDYIAKIPKTVYAFNPIFFVFESFEKLSEMSGAYLLPITQRVQPER